MREGIDLNILREAINKWGQDSQLEMLEEESIELALALQKLKRVGGRALNTKRIDDVYDELADMTIMLAQANFIFDPDRIEERIKFKMDRLKKRLKQK